MQHFSVASSVGCEARRLLFGEIIQGYARAIDTSKSPLTLERTHALNAQWRALFERRGQMKRQDVVAVGGLVLAAVALGAVISNPALANLLSGLVVCPTSTTFPQTTTTILPHWVG